jgi:hypothetical protein
MISFGNSAHTHAEQHDHKQDVGSKDVHHGHHHKHTMNDCDGMCSVEAENEGTMGSRDSAVPVPMQFSQLISQLLTATILNILKIQILDFTSQSVDQLDFLASQWAPMPITPPPRYDFNLS